MSERGSFQKRLIEEVGYEHSGGNFILDKGAPVGLYKDYFESLSNYMRLVKLGWTTWSLFRDKELSQKIEIAERHKVPLCLGGTLFEISYVKGMYEDLLEFIKDRGIHSIEIASGFAVDVEELPSAINVAKRQGLLVMVEVGYKNQQRDDALSIDQRVMHIRNAKDAGADFVVLEAREIGTGYSVFKPNSDNQALLDEILAAIPLEQVVFEAPTRDTQIKLVNTLGPNVNMGNIPFDEIPRVETIRRGLHADTFASVTKNHGK